jgi:hypothetical protein
MAAETPETVDTVTVVVGDNQAVVTFDGVEYALTPVQVHDLRRALDHAYLELH